MTVNYSQKLYSHNRFSNVIFILRTSLSFRVCWKKLVGILNLNRSGSRHFQQGQNVVSNTLKIILNFEKESKLGI